jgi:hypothetical protein
MLPNRIYMHKGGRPIAFPLYRDADIEWANEGTELFSIDQLLTELR